MAILLDGKKLRDSIFVKLKLEIDTLQEKPCLAVIIVGENKASKVYVSHKKKACEKVGIKSLSYELPEDTSEEKLLKLIDQLNDDISVNGILVQLPLPNHIDESKVINRIDQKKDVDGFHPFNVGKLFIGEPVFVSCTPKGIISLLDEYNINVEGKSCTVIGRSNIVGKPIASLLTKKNATVTVAHSRTKNLEKICSNSDILVVAMGRDRFIDSKYVKDGAVVIDVGINRADDGKLYGDVDFDDVKDKVSYITPVPGGVGPMTIASLMENVLISYKIQKGMHG